MFALLTILLSLYLIEDSQMTGHIHHRHRRSLLDTAFLHDDPLRELTELDKLLEDPTNISNIEKDFFRLSEPEFHNRIYNQFDLMQKKIFKESLVGIQDEMSEANKTGKLRDENIVRSIHETGPGFERKEKLYKVPSQDGVRIVRKGLKKYKDNMQHWVEQTFVQKPKTIVKEEKSKLEEMKSNDTKSQSIPLDKLKAFWNFERDFYQLMKKYEKDLTGRVFEYYDKVMNKFLNQGLEHFPFADLEQKVRQEIFEQEHKTCPSNCTAGKH